MAYLPLVTHPAYSYPFPNSHRFPMEKFALIVEHLNQIGLISDSNIFRPGRLNLDILLRTHCPDYIDRFIRGNQSKKELRAMGLPWSDGLVKRTLISPNGTLLAANLALEKGIACHLAGGTHHAHFDFASGFCILNDLAITAKTLLASGKVKRLLIFDCDVHQGDGTARMLEAWPNAFTCSIHCESNFPTEKARSNVDIEIKTKTGDDEYLAAVAKTLQEVIDKAQPELILYDAGVDVCYDDPLGRLNISDQGLAEREHLVLKTCHVLGIPVATVIGGGYHDDRCKLARRHCEVVNAAHHIYCA